MENKTLYEWRATANIAGWECEIEDLEARLQICREELRLAKAAWEQYQREVQS